MINRTSRLRRNDGLEQEGSFIVLRKRKRKPANRKGAAVVEFAVCLPVIIILVLGAIECTTMIFVNQALNVVAYEGIRVAAKRDAETAEVLQRCNEVIAERNLQNAQVTLNPANIDDLERGTQITINVTAPSQQNSALALKFFSGDIVAEAVMFKD